MSKQETSCDTIHPGVSAVFTEDESTEPELVVITVTDQLAENTHATYDHKLNSVSVAEYNKNKYDVDCTGDVVVYCVYEQTLERQYGPDWKLHTAGFYTAQIKSDDLKPYKFPKSLLSPHERVLCEQ